MKTTLLFIVGLAIAETATAESDIEKCQANGKTTYTNFPCSELPSREQSLIPSKSQSKEGRVPAPALLKQQQDQRDRLLREDVREEEKKRLMGSPLK